MTAHSRRLKWTARQPCVQRPGLLGKTASTVTVVIYCTVQTKISSESWRGDASATVESPG